MSHPLVKENARLAMLVEELKRENLELRSSIEASQYNTKVIMDEVNQKFRDLRKEYLAALQAEHERWCAACASEVHDLDEPEEEEPWGLN